MDEKQDLAQVEEVITNSAEDVTPQRKQGLLSRSRAYVVRAVDQTGDGKFDKEDLAVISDSVGAAVDRGKAAIQETARQLELKALRPIFPETLDDAGFSMSKLIRVVERDKKHADSDVCQGSIGYFSEHKGLRIVNIFYDSLPVFGLKLAPDNDYEFYYVDPTDRDGYIALDEYFSYLRVERVNELQRIAQALGAKYFKVTFKEEQTAFSSLKAKAAAKHSNKRKDKTPEHEDASLSHEYENKRFAAVNVAAECVFPGHAPSEPEVCYLQRDSVVKNMIQMRMNLQSPLGRQKYVLNLSTSCGMKENDAAKIDAVLGALKVAGNATVVSEARSESRRFLEYEIEF